MRDSAWFTGIGSVTSALTFQSILMLNRYFCVRWASSLKLFKLMNTFNCQAHKIGIIILSAGCTHTWDYIVCKWLFMVMSFSPFGLGACSWRGMFLIILYIILEYLNHSWDQMGTCLYSLFLVVTFSLQTLPLSFFIRFRWMSLIFMSTISLGGSPHLCGVYLQNLPLLHWGEVTLQEQQGGSHYLCLTRFLEDMG